MRIFYVEEISSNSDISDSIGDSNKMLMEKYRKIISGNINLLLWVGFNLLFFIFGLDVSKYFNNLYLDQIREENIVYI